MTPYVTYGNPEKPRNLRANPCLKRLSFVWVSGTISVPSSRPAFTNRRCMWGAFGRIYRLPFALPRRAISGFHQSCLPLSLRLNVKRCGKSQEVVFSRWDGYLRLRDSALNGHRI
jgi:hypothetical protein